MTQKVKILRNYFDAGELLFKAGAVVPLDAGSQRQVDLGNGELVSAADPEQTPEPTPETTPEPTPQGSAAPESTPEPTAERRAKRGA